MTNSAKVSLVEALERLAVQLPQRVQIMYPADGRVWVRVFQRPGDDSSPIGWRAIGELGDHNLALHKLEYALREEIEGREWSWEVFVFWDGGEKRYAASIRPEMYEAWEESADSNTPAHALALALIAALEAEDAA